MALRFTHSYNIAWLRVETRDSRLVIWSLPIESKNLMVPGAQAYGMGATTAAAKRAPECKGPYPAGCYIAWDTSFVF
jgi:hypothetical protein